MKKKYKRICVAVLVVLGLAAWAATAFSPTAVETETVVSADLVKHVTIQASVLPEKSEILTAAQAGTVAELPYRAGMTVKAGAELVQIRGNGETAILLQKEQTAGQLSAAKREYERLYGEHGVAAAERVAAEGQLRLAETQYQNGRVLLEAGAISRIELETLKNELEAARARSRQAAEADSETGRGYMREQISALENQLELLSDTEGTNQALMPYDGVLWELYVEPGAYAALHQPLARVYRPDSLRLEATVLAEDGADLKEGDQAQVVYADGTAGTAEIAFLARTAVKEISGIGLEENRSQLILSTEALPTGIGAGQQADVTFAVVRASQALTVPATALIPDGEQTIVYVAEGKKARAAAVETGIRESGRVEIRSGLEAGDVIVTDPYEYKITDGTRIKAAGG